MADLDIKDGQNVLARTFWATVVTTVLFFLSSMYIVF